MFNKKKENYTNTLNTVAEACEEHIGPITDEDFKKIMKPRGNHKVNPIISIENTNANFPIIINNETGEAQNNHTYYGELLENVRSRARCLNERKGLEYEVISCKDTTEDQKIDLLQSNIEATDATLTVALADDVLTCTDSVACNIEGKILGFLEAHGISGDLNGNSISSMPLEYLIGMFSYRYPNKYIPTYDITAATYFDFVANRELQIMNNFCGEVYTFIRSIAYNPYLDLGNFDQYPGAHDTLYVCLCNLIYNDLSCLDDALRALITAHCIRIETLQTPARDAYDELLKKQREAYKISSQNKK